MPLLSISSHEALANLRLNRTSLWPDGRRDRTRLTGVATVAFTPGFTLVPGEAIFTAGSCFARNIEKRFAEIGFEVPATALALNADERSSDTENDFLNKYPPHAILNELRWALEPGVEFPDESLIEVKRDQWHDPHIAPNVKPASRERVLERRAMVTALYKKAPSCRVIVLTLGLVEAWYDKHTGYYLNGSPPSRALNGDPDRYRLDVLTVDDLTQALEEIFDLLVRFGHPDFRILLTVSPVPMRSTFTGRDAISANAYSKSALRVAAEAFCLRHNRVDYFPSYEIVSNTNRSAAYIQDNRHVTPQLVKAIVDRVAQAYCPQHAPPEAEPMFAKTAAAALKKALKSKDFERAAELYARLDARHDYERVGYDEFTFRYEYGRVLLRLGSTADAHEQLAIAVAARPEAADAQYQLARALARLQRPIDAETKFRRAAELAPDSLDINLGWANQLIELGAFDDAERAIRSISPVQDDERPAAMLESLDARRAAAASG